MSETYQAIYDAVRSRISKCDIGQAVRDVAQRMFDISHVVVIIQQEFSIAAAEMRRPSAVYRPSIGFDGTKWRALYGDDLMHGVAGFGDTPDEAMRDFDQAWMKQQTAEATRRGRAHYDETKEPKRSEHSRMKRRTPARMDDAPGAEIGGLESGEGEVPRERRAAGGNANEGKGRCRTGTARQLARRKWRDCWAQVPT